MRALRVHVFCVAIAFLGCESSYYVLKGYELNKPITVTVGSTMISWEYGTESSFGKSGIRKQLNYTGTAHDIVHISYQEFTEEEKGSYIRPAFQQDLVYDISESGEITFRSVAIKIVQATQKRITFVVLNDPDDVRRLPLPRY